MWAGLLKNGIEPEKRREPRTELGGAPPFDGHGEEEGEPVMETGVVIEGEWCQYEYTLIQLIHSFIQSLVKYLPVCQVLF